MIKYAKGLQNITTVQGRRRTSTSTRASSALKCQNNVATATGVLVECGLQAKEGLLRQVN